MFSLALILAISEATLRFVGVSQVKSQEKVRTSWVNVPENVWVEHHPVFTEAVAKDGLTAYYIEEGWHWTPKGHALAAKTIEEYLNQKGT